MVRILALALLLSVVVSGCDTRRPVEEVIAAPQQVVSDVELRPWPEAASVRLFVQSGDQDQEGNAVYVRPAGQTLTTAQRAGLERHVRLVSYDREPDAALACFVPHHFLRYYDASGAQIGELKICFCCTGVQADPDIDRPLPSGASWAELTFTAELASAIADLGYETQVGC